MQFFLDEQGQADFVCLTGRTGAKLEITYKGAHASRPADLIDVDEFVGVKSHRAKGKRLTTYDVDTLRFIEPEEPEQEPEPAGEAEPAGVDMALIEAPQGDVPAAGGEAAFEIERARGDADRMIDPEQLNLF